MLVEEGMGVFSCGVTGVADKGCWWPGLQQEKNVKLLVCLDSTRRYFTECVGKQAYLY
jgi:hypothetical protein